MIQDLLLTSRWWLTLIVIGVAALPLTQRLFSKWYDSGYLFAKSVGLAVITYLVYFAGITHLAPFSVLTIIVVTLIAFGVGMYLAPIKNYHWRTWFIEELFFGGCLFFWAWVKAHEPSIHGLEKFMDFGFAKTILNSAYFPSPDMWFAGKFYINYYYFGHTALAVLTKLSGINLAYTFNLMLAGLFAFTATLSFSLAYQLQKRLSFAAITAYIITLGGNLQTIYAFTKGYPGEDAPPPFWKIFTGKIDINYWYANATRFIPFTIHEFPSYSFVVSDIHGHVLSLPFVLLALGLLVEIFWNKQRSWLLYIFYGFLTAVLLMTNALDGPIYMGLMLMFFVVTKSIAKSTLKFPLISIAVAAAASFPFLHYFRSFVTGLAVNCPPAGLASSKIGPLLFETVDKCQKSPLWMMAILWGFFIYCGLWLFAKYRSKENIFFAILFVFSLLLIAFPEFFYFKDIYPLHFRSNTMFKLGYQAFIMFGLVAGFALSKVRAKLFWIGVIPLLILVCIFPIFSVRSYFGNLTSYIGLNGELWLAQTYPSDYAAIQWLDANVAPQAVIVEADGDSYTDYNRFSAFTGRPTIVGWAVHEWLWRGSYDVVSPRREEVRLIYESPDIISSRQIIDKYKVNYIVVGNLERQKFTGLQEAKIAQLGTPVFASGQTIIYSVALLQSQR